MKTPAPERRLAAVQRPASVYRMMTDVDGPSPSSPPLPPGALARLGFRGLAHIAVGHQRSTDFTIVALAYSPDGAALASADRAGSAFVWHARTGEPIQAIHTRARKQSTTGVHSLSFSRDGALLFIAVRSGVVHAMDVRRGDTIRRLRTPGGGYPVLAASPRHDLLATAGGERAVRLWSIADWTYRKLRAPSAPIRSVAFSPCGERVYAGSLDGRVRAWDVASGAIVRELSVPCDRLDAIALSRDETYLAATARNELFLLRAESGALLHRLTVGPKYVFSLAASKTADLIASGDASGDIRLWDPETGREVRTIAPVKAPERSTDLISQPYRWVHALAFSPDGATLASGGAERGVHLWDVATGRRAPPYGHIDRVPSVAISPDSSIAATGSSDRTVRLWSLPSGAPIGQIFEANSGIKGLAFTPDQRSLAVGHETGLTLVSLPSGDFTQPVRLRSICNVIGSRRGAVAIEARSGDVVDATSGRVIFAGGGYAAALSGDGAYLATSPSPGVVLITRQSFPRVSFRIEHGSSDIRELALSESGDRLAAVTTSEALLAWSVRPLGARLLGAIEDQGRITAVAFSPSGRWLVTGDWRGGLRWWDTDVMTETARVEAHAGAILRVVFAPDGRWLVSSSEDRTALVWPAEPPLELWLSYQGKKSR